MSPSVPEDSSNTVYEVDVEWRDAGFGLVFDMEEWMERIEKDLSSFSAIKKFHRTDPQELKNRWIDEVQAEDHDGPEIVINNPPKAWTENPEEAVPILVQVDRIMVNIGLGVLMEDEVEEERNLLKQGHYKPLVVRQSAFFEGLLEFRSMLALQAQKEDTLSSNEIEIIEQMGHKDRIRLAHLLGALNKEEHGLLQEMAKRRNDIAHSAWSDFSESDESQIKSIAQRVHEMLETEVEEAYSRAEGSGDIPTQDGLDMGFEGLDIRTQNLQLSILDVIASSDGSCELARVQRALPEDGDKIEQRCYRMEEIGYIDITKEVLELLSPGKDLLVQEYPEYDK